MTFEERDGRNESERGPLCDCNREMKGWRERRWLSYEERSWSLYEGAVKPFRVHFSSFYCCCCNTKCFIPSTVG